MNWKAPLFALAGAAVGGTVGAVVQAARNKPMETTALVGASLGAILSLVAMPPTKITQAPPPGTGAIQ